MSPVQHLREFIRERLTAAAEEIFSEVEKTIVRYEEDARLLESCWRPQIKLTRIDIPKPHVSMEEEVSADQQPSYDPEEAESQWTEERMETGPPLIKEQQPEPPLIKEEDSEPLLIEEQGNQGPRWIKEKNKHPEHPLIGNQNVEPESLLAIEEKKKTEPLTEEQGEKGGHLLIEEEGLEHPLIQENNEITDSSRLKREQQLLEHLPTTQDQKDVCSCLEGSHFVQKQVIAQMEASILRGKHEEPRTEQFSFHISPVVKNRDQGGSSSTESESRPHTDTKKASLKCDICGKFWRNNSELKRHYRSHTGERPFPCQTCGKSFSYFSYLKVHIRIHTGEKPFLCQTCGKCFSDRSTLMGHKRIHTGERPYSCQTCGKRFSRINTLNVHRRIHTGERPFPCEICDKSFTQGSKLNIHMKCKHKSQK
ncbi:zinc finger protein 34 [Fundulus heteroclitus]|uniref:zinc finger protein 34 n=1 Tax=Fundulus heteroclitus TaxID=8078 RepID=UPI00165ACFBE|nr:zinc finger protein 34 [Fundulus heteroclitus]